MQGHRPTGPRTDDPGSAGTPPRRAGAALPYRAVIADADAVVSGAAGRPALSAAPADLVGRLRAGGTRVALVTTGEAQALSTELFDVAVHQPPGDGPNPTVLTEAADRMGAEPRDVAVVQTTPTGVRAARNAGSHGSSESTGTGNGSPSRWPGQIWSSTTSANSISACSALIRGCWSTRVSTQRMRGTVRH